MADPAGIDADLAGPVSPPRDNGEIVFAQPWERRVFGLTVALCRSAICDWETFRERLIRRIGDDDAVPYWQSWALALEDLLASMSLVPPDQLDARYAELLRRPPDHDHLRRD
jgi:nitrile hydratase accessory protein